MKRACRRCCRRCRRWALCRSALRLRMHGVLGAEAFDEVLARIAREYKDLDAP